MLGINLTRIRPSLFKTDLKKRSIPQLQKLLGLGAAQGNSSRQTLLAVALDIQAVFTRVAKEQQPQIKR
jgi:hypothetical protein